MHSRSVLCMIGHYNFYYVCMYVCICLYGWIKMPLGTKVGLGRGHIVLDGDSAPPPPKGTAPQISAHVYCSQTVAHLSYC